MHKFNRMQYRPSLSFLCCLIPLLAVGGVAAVAWHKATSLPVEVRAATGFVEAIKFKDTIETNPPSPEQIADVREQAIALKAKLVAEFPALYATAHPVADDANGFLLLYKLAGSGHPFPGRLPISKEFDNLLGEQARWDPATARRCLAEHAEFVTRLERIAALPTRSSSNMPAEYNGIVAGLPAKRGCDILLLKARLAAAGGDQAETLRLVAAAGNLGSHFHNVECPSLYSETVVILIDLGIQRAAYKTLLPVLGRNAELASWKRVLGNRTYTCADFARVMCGEWNIGADYITIPVLLAGAKNHQVPDADAVIRTYTIWFNTCVTRLPSLGLAEMAAALKPPGDVTRLSEEGRDVIDSFYDGFQPWTKGYIMGAAKLALYHAALDLLIMERSGSPLAASDVVRIPCEPVSGLPFEFDSNKRVLAAPPSTAVLGVEPLALPW